MSSNLRLISLFISLVAFTYILRQEGTYPGNFLKHQLARLVQEQKLSERFCSNGYDNITFSPTETEKADSFRSSLRNMREDNSLTAFITRDEPNNVFLENYAKSFKSVLIPWAALFCVGIIGCLGCTINWCCMNCRCCKDRCCRICQRPKSPRFRNCWAIGSLLLMLFTIAAGIVGILFVNRTPRYAHGVLCSAIKFAETTENGSAEDNWVGIQPGIDRIDSLVSQINQAVSGLSTYDSLFKQFENDLSTLANSVDSIYTQNKDATLDRINPDVSRPYTPYYIEALGEIRDMAMIDLEDREETIESINKTFVAMKNNVNSSTSQILQAISDNRPILVDASSSISNALSKADQNQPAINKAIGLSSGTLMGLSIANIVVSGLAIISTVLVCFGVKFLNKFIYLSWCAMGLLMIIGWAISSVLFGVNILLSETCDVGTEMLQDPVFFNTSFNKLAAVFELGSNDINKTRNVVYTCVHGNGDLSEEFNLTSHLTFFDQIFNKIDEFSAEAAVTIANLPDTLMDLQDISLDDFKNGSLPDSDETTNDMTTLSFYTSRSPMNPCPIINDRWVLNSVQCALGDLGTPLEPGSPDDFNLPNPTCIGYNTWKDNGNDISSRYTRTWFSGRGCTVRNNNNFAIRYVESLERNRRQSDALIDRLTKDLTDLEGEYQTFRSSLQTVPQTLTGTNSTVTGIYLALVNPTDGLIKETNCKFVVDALEDLRDVTCTGLGAIVFEISIIFLILSFVTLLGTLALFCLAKRFTVEKKLAIDRPDFYIKRIEA